MEFGVYGGGDKKQLT